MLFSIYNEIHQTSRPRSLKSVSADCEGLSPFFYISYGRKDYLPSLFP
uniref:Uncharacterized protein n=1 Tax=Rhizophora mucronata TaxID=61149 RepID=A0A2P2QC79_RHIMU